MESTTSAHLQPRCSEKDVDFILSSSYESEIGIAQIAKLCYRLQLPRKPMGLDTCRYFAHPLTSTPLAIQDEKLLTQTTWSFNKAYLDGCIRMSF